MTDEFSNEAVATKAHGEEASATSIEDTPAASVESAASSDDASAVSNLEAGISPRRIVSDIAQTSSEAQKRRYWTIAGLLLIILLAAVLCSLIGLKVTKFQLNVVADTGTPSDGKHIVPYHPPSNNSATSNGSVTKDPTTISSTASPTLHPTNLPLSPSWAPSELPSSIPSSVPSLSPSVQRSPTPTVRKTEAPSTAPTDSAASIISHLTTTFYAIGDVPYSEQQAVELAVQMRNIPSDAEFVVHVGDMRRDVRGTACPRSDYNFTSTLLRLSPVPVFIIPGDNDWTDCTNRWEALGFWKDEFLGFESRYWNSPFQVVRQPIRDENFAFVHKNALFIGIDLVGVPVYNQTEWNTRLKQNFAWTQDRILNYTSSLPANSTGRVVIFAHANPSKAHNIYFNPLKNFISNTLHNSIPMLYLNGDKHVWSYNESWFGEPSFLRMMVNGGTSQPPLQVEVHATGQPSVPWDAFTYDRMLGNYTSAARSNFTD